MCSKTIYIKGKKKSTNGRQKKTVTTVATVRLTKALLPLQYLYSANTLSVQYRSTVAALALFIYKINQQLSVGTFTWILVCELVVYSKLMMFVIIWRKILDKLFIN